MADGDEVMFVASDIAKILGYRDAAKILSNSGTLISEKQLHEWMTANDWICKHDGSWHATAKHCTAGHLVMVMSTKHGTKADGTKFAFPPPYASPEKAWLSSTSA